MNDIEQSIRATVYSQVSQLTGDYAIPQQVEARVFVPVRDQVYFQVGDKLEWSLRGRCEVEQYKGAVAMYLAIFLI
jgi:hypothetical protein